MRNLSNLGLVEMTEQEMREVNGGFAWVPFAIALAGYLLYESLTTTANAPSHPGICTCDIDPLTCQSCAPYLFR